MGDGSNHFVQEFVAGWFGGEIEIRLVCFYLTIIFNFRFPHPCPAVATGVAGLLAGHPFDTIKVLSNSDKHGGISFA